MPKIRWAGCDDADKAAKVLGPRARDLRESRGLTIRELAARVGVSKNTLLRLEQGAPVAEKLLIRICNGLQTVPPNLLVPESDWTQPIQVHRGETAPWRIAFRREKAPSIYEDFQPISECQERKRLGRVGFVSGFYQAQGCMLRGGKLQAAVYELFGNQEKAGFRHSGEEFVYCMRGRLRVTVGKTVTVLEPGDSATFWSRYRHRYESDLPADSPESTLLMMVWYEGEEEASSLAEDDEC